MYIHIYIYIIVFSVRCHAFLCRCCPPGYQRDIAVFEKPDWLWSPHKPTSKASNYGCTSVSNMIWGLVSIENHDET